MNKNPLPRTKANKLANETLARQAKAGLHTVQQDTYSERKFSVSPRKEKNRHDDGYVSETESVRLDHSEGSEGEDEDNSQTTPVQFDGDETSDFEPENDDQEDDGHDDSEDDFIDVGESEEEDQSNGLPNDALDSSDESSEEENDDEDEADDDIDTDSTLKAVLKSTDEAQGDDNDLPSSDEEDANDHDFTSSDESEEEEQLEERDLAVLEEDGVEEPTLSQTMDEETSCDNIVRRSKRTRTSVPNYSEDEDDDEDESPPTKIRINEDSKDDLNVDTNAEAMNTLIDLTSDLTWKFTSTRNIKLQNCHVRYTRLGANLKVLTLQAKIWEL
jgi:hypothetical protein